MLNKLTVSELAELSNLSKSYISQVKNGKRPPSEKLIRTLHDISQKPLDNWEHALIAFLESRREGISPETIRDYKGELSRALPHLGLNPTTKQIQSFLNNLTCSSGGKFGYYKCLRAFYNWLYSPRSNMGYKTDDNPITWVEAPKKPKLILPSLNREQVLYLIDTSENLRDKAILALFTESGLRLSELTNIKPQDINWENHTIKVMGKGRKEAYCPFGELSTGYLKEWLSQYSPDGNIWDINEWGISSMLRRLEKKTGLPCNPHTFRRTFACLLRKAGVDTMTIKDLGRWESLEMVQRYTRSFTFQDSLKFYKAPLSNP